MDDIRVTEMPPAAGAEVSSSRSGRRGVMLGVVGAMAAFVAMFAVALVHLAQRRWFPVLDLAMTEMRIRDVANGHPPLVGLIGRIGPVDAPGSHPGPLSFYLLWPAYRLFGSSAFAMELSTVVLNLVAIATSLVFAGRRRGTGMVLVVATALVSLMWVLGPELLIQPWNPYLPVLWYFAFVTCIWSVLDDDLVALPVAVFAGSLCAQTHISYVVIVATPILLAAGALARRWWRTRGTRAGTDTAIWSGGSVLLGVALWAPPVGQEFLSASGNLSTIWKHFSNPPEAAIGLGRGAATVLRHFDLAGFVGQRTELTGSVLPGLVLIAMWLAVVGASRLARTPTADTLNLVIAVITISGILSASRIFGPPHYYLTLWAWTIGALMVVALVLTTWTLADGHLPRYGRVMRNVGIACLTAIFGAAGIGFARQAADVGHPSGRDSVVLGHLAPPTIAAVTRASREGSEIRPPYVVTWYDPIALGSIGFGVINELERAGLEVGTIQDVRVAVRDHRVLRPGHIGGVVHVAAGRDIEIWDARPQATRVAYYDPRTPVQQALSARYRAEAVQAVAAAGIDRPSRAVEDQGFTLSFDPRVSAAGQRALQAYLALGLPTAVFIEPFIPDAAGAP